jgi:hydroxyacylglutathione hydrolase
MLHVKSLVFSPFQENTYIVYSDNNECAIVDPGMFFPGEEQDLVSFLQQMELKPVKLLQTHLHLDHVFGTSFVYRQYGLKPMAHEDDAFFTERTIEMAAQFGLELSENPPAPVKFLKDKELVRLGEVTFEVIHIPGHSPGGILFYCKEEKVLLAGDVLFKGSIGRSDLPGGNQHDLIEGIRCRILTLPDDVTIYPGHGPITTIGEEKRTNPFLQ